MHLDDPALDDLLDDVLPSAARESAERHLADCADCRARLAARQQFFALIESAPEVAPVRDLRRAVVSTLAQRPAELPRWTVLVAAVQAVVAIALVALAIAWIGPRVISQQLGSLTVFGVEAGRSSLQALLTSLHMAGDAVLRPLTLDLSVARSGLVLALAVTAAALGLFGNGIWFALNWGKVRKP